MKSIVANTALSLLLVAQMARASSSTLRGASSSQENNKQPRRHLLTAGTECVPYLRLNMADAIEQDANNMGEWYCEFTPEDAEMYGSNPMVPIEGLTHQDFDDRGIVSGGAVLKLGPNSYVEEHAVVDAAGESASLHVEREAGMVLETMEDLADDSKYRRHRRRLAGGATGAYKTVVVRIKDQSGNKPSYDAARLENDVFVDAVSLKKQTEACSYNAMTIEQATDVSSRADNGDTINGVVDVTISGTFDNYNSDNGAAYSAAASVLGNNYRWNYDLVLFCSPAGTSGWIAYAYVNHPASFYNDKWCGYVSSQMHEVGHNIGLAHSGLPGVNEYADQSGYMGYSYSGDDTPKMCYNPPKSYQLGWYSAQTETIDPLNLPGGNQEIILNGVSDYKPDGSNGDKVVALRLAYQGDRQNGLDWYIGYNRKEGINEGTVKDGNLVTIHEKANPDGHDGGYNQYGLSERIAALGAGQSHTWRIGSKNIQVTVNYINGKDAKITVSDGTPTQAPAPDPTRAPTRAPTPAPTNSPTSAPTKAPTPAPEEQQRDTPTGEPTVFTTMDGCDDDNSADFYALVKKKKGVSKKIDCAWLSKKSKTKRKQICKQNVPFPYTNDGPNDQFNYVKHICMKTCGIVGMGECKSLKLAQ